MDVLIKTMSDPIFKWGSPLVSHSVIKKVDPIYVHTLQGTREVPTGHDDAGAGNGTTAMGGPGVGAGTGVGDGTSGRGDGLREGDGGLGFARGDGTGAGEVGDGGNGRATCSELWNFWCFFASSRRR